MTGANHTPKDVDSPAFTLYAGTTQLPPTPAGPDRSSPLIRSTGASPSIQLAATSEIPSQRICVFSIRMLGPWGCAGVGGASTLATASLTSSFVRPSELRLRRHWALPFEPAAPALDLAPRPVHALFASLCVLAEGRGVSGGRRLACASHQASKIRILATLRRPRACILSYWG
jgi:hypothetical protein